MPGRAPAIARCPAEATGAARFAGLRARADAHIFQEGWRSCSGEYVRASSRGRSGIHDRWKGLRGTYSTCTTRPAARLGRCCRTSAACLSGPTEPDAAGLVTRLRRIRLHFGDLHRRCRCTGISGDAPTRGTRRGDLQLEHELVRLGGDGVAQASQYLPDLLAVQVHGDRRVRDELDPRRCGRPWSGPYRCRRRSGLGPGRRRSRCA